MVFSPERLDRFARHIVLPQVGGAGQFALAEAHVALVGLGGIGSPALQYLAGAGIGHLTLIDDGKVETSNLQRQTIYSERDVGHGKAVSARRWLANFDHKLEVSLHDRRIEKDNAAGAIAGADLVLDGTDNFATRYLVNDACVLLGKPYVWGSIYRFDGQASVFWAEHGPCYRCLYPEPPPPDVPATDTAAPATDPMTPPPGQTPMGMALGQEQPSLARRRPATRARRQRAIGNPLLPVLQPG